MSTLTTTFILKLVPVYLGCYDKKAGINLRWRRVNGHIELSCGSANLEFASELAAWQAAIAYHPALLDDLSRSQNSVYMGYAQRARLLLAVGEARFDEMAAAVDEEIMHIYHSAVTALGAKVTMRAKPKARRASPSRALSWIDVRSTMLLPYAPEPELVIIRCIPSPYEEKTWSVRVRTPTSGEGMYRSVLRGMELLTANLLSDGIVVKDVQNGTAFDL